MPFDDRATAGREALGEARPVLDVRGLRKAYGAAMAVDGVSFSVGGGEIVGLLGPNGAGKTTTIDMILGVLEPSAGAVRIEGAEVASRRRDALARTNFAAVYAPLPGNLTVAQNLRIFALLYGVRDLVPRIEAILDELDLRRFRDVKCGVLSSGEQTRVGLAKALLNRPRLLLLDEPTASLDPATARELRAKIRALAHGGGAGVLWTSHNMVEVEEVCDRVLFLSHGRILLEGDPRRLPAEHGKETLDDLFVAVAREPLALDAPAGDLSGPRRPAGREGRDERDGRTDPRDRASTSSARADLSASAATRSPHARAREARPARIAGAIDRIRSPLDKLRTSGTRHPAIRVERVGAIVLRQAYLLRGSPARVLPLFAWVAIDVVLWGFITRFLNAVTASGLNFVPMLLGAVLLWDFFIRVMQGVTMAFFEDVWTRNFLNVFAAPISTAEYVTGLVVSSVATSTVGLAVMLLFATAGFGLSFLGYGAAVVPFLGVLFLFGIALGIAATAVVLRLGPASEWLIWPIPAVLSPFAGVFYPLSTLPAWMRAVGRALPPSYVFEGLRAIVAGHAVAWAALAWGTALAVLDIVLAAWLFTGVYRYAVRTGLLARYAAESVT